jgi:autotransporter strand-loop-strand O-heptosyltransferase
MDELVASEAGPAESSATGAVQSAKADPPPKGAYPPPASVPTQSGPRGIRFDFNQGARVVLPARTEGVWHVRLRDLDTGNILFETETKGAFVASSKRFYVRFRVEVSEGGTMVLEHEYDCRDRPVLVQFPVGTLGDILAWLPYAPRFQKLHGCRMVCALSGLIIPLVKDAYPDIRFVTHEEMEEDRLAEDVYATYSMGLFFDDTANVFQPTDFRHVGLHRTAGYILGVDPTETPPLLALPDDSRPIPEPYVCVAVQSSSGCKYWTNPTGWSEVVAAVKARGYRVICIDQKPVHGHGLMYTHIPHGAEDETGDRPLAERARWLKHAAAFVGLSSGLSWLAWAAGCPVVLISGFTHPTNEFTTPFRVVNWHACNSCWNDPKLRFDHKDFLWCPRHQNTPRHFECTKLITGAHVVAVVARALAIGRPGVTP